MQTMPTTAEKTQDPKAQDPKYKQVNLSKMSAVQLARFAKRQKRRGNPEAAEKVSQVILQRVRVGAQAKFQAAMGEALGRLNVINRGDRQKSEGQLLQMLEQIKGAQAPVANPVEDPANQAATYPLEKGEEIQPAADQATMADEFVRRSMSQGGLLQ